MPRAQPRPNLPPNPRPQLLAPHLPGRHHTKQQHRLIRIPFAAPPNTHRVRDGRELRKEDIIDLRAPEPHPRRLQRAVAAPQHQQARRRVVGPRAPGLGVRDEGDEIRVVPERGERGEIGVV
ncbi:hypothetical protein V496_07232, partial [Pseudogymnoascus sp. VKM F-4515 (FW-2607)]